MAEYGKPEAPPWIFENIAEASKMAKRVFFIYLSMILYTIVTLASITDRQILLNSGVRLPILQVDVPLSGYVWFALISIPVIFAYMQLYLGRIRGLIEQLQSDFAPVPQRRLYPWIFTMAMDPDPSMLGWGQMIFAEIAQICILVILSVTMPLCKKMWLLTNHSMYELLFGVYMVLVFTLYICLYIFQESICNLRPWRAGRISAKVRRLRISILGILALSVALLYGLSIWLPGSYSKGIPAFLRPYFRLEYQTLVNRPFYERKGMYWLYLDGARLPRASVRNTDISHTSLENANLSESKAQYALFVGCNLKYANMEKAELMGACLDSAILDSAILRGSDFSGGTGLAAHFNWIIADSAIFEGANLKGSEFIGARLYGANLAKADLSYCNFRDADLSFANLDSANVIAINLTNTNLSGAILTNISWPFLDVLESAATLYNAEMDPHVKEYIQRVKPQLLEPPRQ